MTIELASIDRLLLDQLQREVPLVERPYAELGARVDLSEADVLARVAELSGPPPAPIRQVSAIFDSKRLGYQSCLVAAKVDEGRLAHAVKVINSHPGVSHNYRREHAFNLWFTLAVPPGSKLGLEGTLDILKRLSGAQEMRPLPTVKMHKIGVRFDLSDGEGEASLTPPSTNTAVTAPSGTMEITEADKPAIRVLQRHLPLLERPFDGWAAEADMTVADLLAAAARYGESGVMRRFSAVLRHRAIGVSANAMGVWIVPPTMREEFGRLAADYAAVSHCYQRPSYPPEWPYSMFTMVHGRTRDECEATLRDISNASGIRDYTALYSTEEYKKIRVRYFVGDIEEWDRENGG
jgi:DNA-binding Lrp family transcriptional regulator